MENYRNTIKILSSSPPWAINNGLSLRPAEIFGQLSFRTITRRCKLLPFDDFVSSRFKLISRGFLSVLSELKSKKIFNDYNDRGNFFNEKHFRKRFSKLAFCFSVNEKKIETVLFIKADVNVCCCCCCV